MLQKLGTSYSPLPGSGTGIGLTELTERE